MGNLSDLERLGRDVGEDIVKQMLSGSDASVARADDDNLVVGHFVVVVCDVGGREGKRTGGRRG